MMKTPGNIFRLFFALSAILFLTHCSQVPQPSGYLFSTMPKMQSARHWQILAQDVAEQMVQAVSSRSFDATDTFYIKPKKGDFNRIFRDALIENFLRLEKESGQGCVIRTTPAKGPDTGIFVIEYDVYVVKHRADRFQRPPLGLITLMGTAVREARDVGENLIIPAAALLDITVGSTGTVSNNEVVIKMAIQRDGVYEFMRNDVYYINDLDVGHYRTGERPQLQSKEYTIIGDNEK